MAQRQREDRLVERPVPGCEVQAARLCQGLWRDVRAAPDGLERRLARRIHLFEGDREAQARRRPGLQPGQPRLMQAGMVMHLAENEHGARGRFAQQRGERLGRGRIGVRRAPRDIGTGRQLRGPRGQRHGAEQAPAVHSVNESRLTSAPGVRLRPKLR